MIQNSIVFLCMLSILSAHAMDAQLLTGHLKTLKQAQSRVRHLLGTATPFLLSNTKQDTIKLSQILDHFITYSIMKELICCLLV